MNVLYVSNFFEAGKLTSGSPIIFDGYIKNLSKSKKIKLNVISIGDKTAIHENENYNIYVFQKRNLYYIPFFMIFLIFKIKKLIKRLNPDVIHVGCTGYAYLFLAMILQRKYPLVTTVLGILSKELPLRQKEHKKNWLMTNYKIFFEKYTLPKLKNIIVPTKHIVPHIKNLGASEAKYFTVPDGINYSKIQSYQPIKDYKADILFLSTLDKLKGLDVLIHAISLISSEFQNLKVIIGGKGPRENSFKDLVKKLGLENIISFKGIIKGEKNKYGAIKSCKVLVAPSRWDCQPYAVIEGAACGVPTIASNASNPQFLDDEKTGLVFDSEDSKDFALKIKKILDNNELQKKMGKEGIKKSIECDWRNVVNKTKTIYKDIINSHNKIT